MSSIFYLPLELNSEIEEVYYLYKGIVADYNVNTEFSTYHLHLTVKSKRSITFIKALSQTTTWMPSVVFTFKSSCNFSVLVLIWMVIRGNTRAARVTLRSSGKSSLVKHCLIAFRWVSEQARDEIKYRLKVHGREVMELPTGCVCNNFDFKALFFLTKKVDLYKRYIKGCDPPYPGQAAHLGLPLIVTLYHQRDFLLIWRWLCTNKIKTTNEK